MPCRAAGLAKRRAQERIDNIAPVGDILRSIATAIAHKTARRSPAPRRPGDGANDCRSTLSRSRMPAQAPVRLCARPTGDPTGESSARRCPSRARIRRPPRIRGSRIGRHDGHGPRPCAGRKPACGSPDTDAGVAKDAIAISSRHRQSMPSRRPTLHRATTTVSDNGALDRDRGHRSTPPLHRAGRDRPVLRTATDS